MKKVFVRFYLLLLSICLFTACGSDENNDVNNDKPELNDGSVVINENGTTSNGSRYTPIDDRNFYLDYIKYSIEEAHLIVSGYDKTAFNGVAKIEPLIKFKGISYDVLGIGDEAFQECSTLTSITIPNSVTTIGKSTFYGCKGLTSINIPNSIINIGKSAFTGCSMLTSVYLTDLTAWCNINFENAGSNPLHSGRQHIYINGEEIKDLIIPNGVTSIGDYVFAGYSGLTSVIIPSSVKSIGTCAFYRCYNLTSIDIPNSVTNIGNSAFSDCSGLTSITIPNNVVNIGQNAFSQCYKLTSVTIPNSVTNIGNGAFYNCNKLSSVHIFDIEAWCNISFGDSDANPLYFAHHLYLGEKEIKDLVIPNSVTTIKYQAFFGCSGLNSITIPNSVTSIEEAAFAGCSGLTSVNIPNGVTSIGSSAFGGCSSLTSIIIPNSIETIRYHAFSACSSLTDVYCHAENVPYSDYRYSIIDPATISQVTLHVPAASVSLYQYSETWKYCGNIVALTDSDPKPMDGN